MLICFRTLPMDRPELNIPLIKTYLQSQECPRPICQPITVPIATTPAVFANEHQCMHNLRGNNPIASTTSAIPRKRFRIAHTDKNILKANVAAERLAALDHSRKVP